ncbi:MAG: CTP synthase, partial [Parachlamydiaceae bacterium]|nr:CTP synthase [Parachlamydiaceae bacterium]
IESLPFLETIRQFTCENRTNCLNIHLTYVPYLKAAGEVKTKPSQHSVQCLRGIGIIPDIIVCRSELSLEDSVKDKISLFCNVNRRAVIEEIDVKESIYEVPLQLHQEGIDQLICDLLQLPNPPIDLTEWENIIETIRQPKGTITVGIVGKYVQHQDAYKSVFESLSHGALAAGYKLVIKKFEADQLPQNHEELLKIIQGCDGYLIPGGFGKRGWEGKILAAQYCREEKIPYFGICLGMQVMAVEFARHVLGYSDANSTEIDPLTKTPIISKLSEQQGIEDLGGTMRLGAYVCKLKSNSRAYQAYQSSEISERHRHRYEFNNQFKEELESKGYIFSGVSKEENLCEISEISDHPWMVGVQFHPEFKSKPTNPHPLFRDFVQAMINYQMQK